MITWVIEIYAYDSVYMIDDMNMYDRNDVIVMNYMKERQIWYDRYEWERGIWNVIHDWKENVVIALKRRNELIHAINCKNWY